MKKILLSAIVFAALSFSAFAQSPEAFKYQAVVRDASQNVIPNQAVGMQLTILQGSATGTIVYQETFAPTSNAYGLVNLEIGTGTVVSGTFSTIDWSAGPYFIETALDATGGTSYSVMGTSQLLSVPYALHAKSADAITGGITETDPVFVASVANGITATDTTNWNNHTVDTDTHIDSLGVVGLGFTAGAHTVDTDTHIDSLGITGLGFVAGAHTTSLWNANGNNIFNANSGNIGIGTATPISLLDVAGRSHISTLHIDGRDSVLLQGGYMMWNKINGNGTTDFINQIGIGSVGGFRFAESTTSDAQTDLMVITGTGNVGIGTITPSSKLEISNALSTGALNNFSEYNILLWKNATATKSYGFGVRSSTLVYNTDFYHDFDVQGVTAIRIDANGIVEEPWQNATLINSWANLAGYDIAQYYKDKEGIVHVHGVVTGGLVAMNTDIFTLPVGYRPTLRKIKMLANSIASTGNVVGRRIDILPDGRVQVKDQNVDNGFLVLDFSFRP